MTRSIERRVVIGFAILAVVVGAWLAFRPSPARATAGSRTCVNLQVGDTAPSVCVPIV